MKTANRLMTIAVLSAALATPAAMAEENSARPTSATSPATFSIDTDRGEQIKRKSRGFSCDADLAYHFDKECAAFEAAQQDEAGKSLCCHSVSTTT